MTRRGGRTGVERSLRSLAVVGAVVAVIGVGANPAGASGSGVARSGVTPHAVACGSTQWSHAGAQTPAESNGDFDWTISGVIATLELPSSAPAQCGGNQEDDQVAATVSLVGEAGEAGTQYVSAGYDYNDLLCAGGTEYPCAFYVTNDRAPDFGPVLNAPGETLGVTIQATGATPDTDIQMTSEYSGNWAPDFEESWDHNSVFTGGFEDFAQTWSLASSFPGTDADPAAILGMDHNDGTFSAPSWVKDDPGADPSQMITTSGYGEACYAGNAVWVWDGRTGTTVPSGCSQ